MRCPGRRDIARSISGTWRARARLVDRGAALELDERRAEQAAARPAPLTPESALTDHRTVEPARLERRQDRERRGGGIAARVGDARGAAQRIRGTPRAGHRRSRRCRRDDRTRDRRSSAAPCASRGCARWSDRPPYAVRQAGDRPCRQRPRRACGTSASMRRDDSGSDGGARIEARDTALTGAAGVLARAQHDDLEPGMRERQPDELLAGIAARPEQRDPRARAGPTRHGG